MDKIGCLSGLCSKPRSLSGSRSWFGTEPYWIFMDFNNFNKSKSHDRYSSHLINRKIKS